MFSHSRSNQLLVAILCIIWFLVLARRGCPG
jgi:hypothetical protein